MPTPGPLDHFSALEDPRQCWKTLYPLNEVLLIVPGGVMAGADDFVEISLWCKRNQAWLQRFLPFEHGVPSHETLEQAAEKVPPLQRFENMIHPSHGSIGGDDARDGRGERVAVQPG